jgi:hypothetical protein
MPVACDTACPAVITTPGRTTNPVAAPLVLEVDVFRMTIFVRARSAASRLRSSAASAAAQIEAANKAAQPATGERTFME